MLSTRAEGETTSKRLKKRREDGQPPPSGRLISKPSLRPLQDAPTLHRKAPGHLGDPTRDSERTGADASGHWLDQRPSLPKLLGPYEITGEIARGGMGIVLRGHHTGLKRDVAIKLLSPEVALVDEQSRQRFMREAEATAKLRHPGIIQIHDVAEQGGLTYLVMDLVEGESLKNRLTREGKLDPRQAATLVASVCHAVAHAHEHGILHRDLKPHNVLLNAAGEPILTDFGLAKVVRDEPGDSRRLRAMPAKGTAPNSSKLVVELTQDGDVLGTPLYMAPEQIDPDLGRLGPRTDVYSLGGLLYECLTGRTPFEDDCIYTIMDKALNVAPRPPRDLDPGIPADLEAIALRCLEKRPLARYRSAEDVAKDLDRYLTGAPVLVKPHLTSKVDSGRHTRPGDGPWRPLLVAGLLVGIGVFFGFGPGSAWLDRGSENPEGLAPVGAASVAPESPRPTPTALEAPPESSWGKLSPRVGLKLANEPVTNVNAERLCQEGYVDAMLAFGYAILRGKFPSKAPGDGLKWLKRAAEEGHPQACLILGMIHGEGRFQIREESTTAITWFRRGAELGSPDCMMLAGVYLSRQESLANSREAARWLKEADRAGNSKALTLLGRLTADGHGEGNPADAIGIWERAAEQGSDEAMLLLAVTYQRGRLAPVDHSRSMKWLRLAADAGNPEGMFGLGQAHELGVMGQVVSLDQAREWYRRAAAKGHELAAFRLKDLGE